MKRFIAFAALAIFALGCSPSVRSKEKTLENTTVRIMTFNIWGYGKGRKFPPARIAEVIKASKADIVGLQENRKTARALADMLGWHYVKQGRSAALLTRFEIVETTEKKHGIKIRLASGQEVFVFNVHFLPSPYQPYQLLNIPYGGAPFIKTEKEAIAAAGKVHGGHLKSLLEEIQAARDQEIPIFITGDFNEPSHLDWTEPAARSGRHPIKVSYPSSSALTEAGFADAYRTVHPDEMKMPGYTWTPVTKITDPKDHHDRIDFIYFRGKGVRVKRVEIVGENSKNADVVVKAYPFDHRAVVATVGIAKQPGGSKPKPPEPPGNSVTPLSP
ncbi:MAG: endonuclease/exonuclease/phosphatase family protein [Phycisphaerae bacterium]|jgi:endonuclease/exonuclease/phosphatase family metal-dependent hydrolase|nr:endonuclease/exonuclease/phosphatase family protein [Phycisphaerae bacterium]